jgi:hypothetical protein
MSELELDFLSLLEEREARLLSWGYVDGAFEKSELEELAEGFVLDHDETGTLTGADLLNSLRRRGLLLEVDDGIGICSRTRMAETVRLAARLRQLFPKHRDAGWTLAPTLVADYRLVTRPRAYPRRNIATSPAIDDLAAGGPAVRRTALEALLSQRGDDFKLSRFQVDAAREIFAGLDNRRSGGTIVGAGTGSGKTLAFYLPALSLVAESAAGQGTKVLAIYPRIELLRDQLAEAFREARRLDGVTSGPSVRLGALYGSTPHEASGALRQWKPRGEDRICPYMLCPSCSTGTLVWSRADIEAANHRLVCASCGAIVDERHLCMTRRQLREQPPEVLFLTTEMLNRVLMDGRMRHIVGVGRRASPVNIVLLDEVHTYEGSTGAHVAGVLRRWRHARRRPVHFVGLSATLKEAPSFFSALTGLGEHQVASIEPREEDLQYEGKEYLLALRSDPYSGAGVLSTTIQTAMLLMRALDPVGGGPSGGAFGQRVFAFTDDLDVTNRLFFDLLDAEGLNSWGQPEKASLAALRAPIGGDLAARRAAGQVWDALERLGHQLDEKAHLRVGRTTSQDADVDRGASGIVATASLEVGFNDPRVGAVMQHKSPHDAAAFLQRKGRAGRQRGMRPWTVAVLSDFGRDRLTYQAYDRLFDPELAPRSLPVANPAVVRMQAVFATLDWLADRLGGSALIWTLLQRPSGTGRWGERDRETQGRLADLIATVVVDAGTRDELSAHLRQALDVDEVTVQEILWEPPRPLITTALPTAIRRLRTDWRHLERGPRQDHVGDGPLPEFVVSRLFGDLALPEVVVVTPPQTRNEEERREPMRAAQAMNAYAPGRVSHRLTIAHRYARHWVAPPALEDGQGRLEIQEFVKEFEELGSFGPPPGIRVLRPLVIEVTAPPSEVLNSSHGRLQWKSEIIPSAASDQSIRPPTASPLAALVEEVVFFTHGGLTHSEIRRWASTCDIETLTLSNMARGSVELVDGRDGQVVALGLAIDADAVAIEVRVPRDLVTGQQLDERHLGGLRVERFRETFSRSASVPRTLGSFDAERLADALLLALLDEVSRRDIDIASAYLVLQEEQRLSDAIEAALDRSTGDEGERAAERRGELLAALGEEPISEALDEAAVSLWEDPDRTWDTWAAGRLAASVGAACHAAFEQICPEYDADDLVVDLDSPAADGTIRVWLSEQTVGGGGLIQEALRRVADRPRRFFDLVESATDPGLDELVDAEMRKIARAVVDGGPIQDTVDAVRAAETHDSQAKTFEDLLAVLEAEGVFVCHPVVSAVSARLLRPGSNRRTDRATTQLIDAWDVLERTSALDVDLRTFAELSARDDTFERTAQLTAPADDPVGWRVGQITGLLWPRGAAVRAQALRAPNPYETLPTPDPYLLRACMPARARAVPVDRLHEIEAKDGRLATTGVVEVQAGPTEARRLRAALLEAAATPIEAGVLLHYPRVDGIARDGAGLRARLVLDLVGE